MSLIYCKTLVLRPECQKIQETEKSQKHFAEVTLVGNK
jgi:hypothetical protein